MQPDPFQLFREVSGDVDPRTGKCRLETVRISSFMIVLLVLQIDFTTVEATAISVVGRKERELAEIRQWETDLKDKLSLKKFNQIFNNDNEERRAVTLGGGTALMEREAIKGDRAEQKENKDQINPVFKLEPEFSPGFLRAMHYVDTIRAPEVGNVRKRQRLSEILNADCYASPSAIHEISKIRNKRHRTSGPEFTTHATPITEHSGFSENQCPSEELKTVLSDRRYHAKREMDDEEEVRQSVEVLHSILYPSCTVSKLR